MVVSLKLLWKYFPVWIAATACLLNINALNNGFALDDYYQKLVITGHHPIRNIPDWDVFDFADGNPEVNHSYIEKGIMPWWTHPEMFFHFFRPVASLTHGLDYTLIPNSPRWMILQNIVWYGLLVVAAGYFYRALLGSTMISNLAAAVFAFDKSHGHAIGWISNRNLLIGSFLGILTILFFINSISSKRLLNNVLSTICLILGLLSSEAVVSIPAFLIFYVIFVDRRKSGQRLKHLLLPCSVAFLWAMMYVFQGYGAAHSGLYIDPARDFTGFLKAGVLRLPAMLISLFTGLPSEVSYIFPDVYFPWILGLGMLMLLFFIMSSFRYHWSDPVFLFFACSTGAALIPLVSSFPHDRTLVLPSLGSAGMIGYSISFIFSSSRTIQIGLPGWRYRRITGWFFFLLCLVFAPFMQRINASSFKTMNTVMQNQLQSIFNQQSYPSGTTVLVTCPVPFFAHHTIIRKIAEEEPYPDTLRVIAPASTDVILTAVSRQKIRIRAADGFITSPMDDLFRNLRKSPFVIGDSIHLKDMDISIDQVDSGGHPITLSITCQDSIYSDQYRWFIFLNGTYSQIQPPPISGSLEIQAAPVVDDTILKAFFE